ncbi:MAG: hypothetical protein PUF13_11810, partial [Lachnospiraceae bacterium]|nr:hypothetical protein [Lachnospiraceae bacterium]
MNKILNLKTKRILSCLMAVLVIVLSMPEIPSGAEQAEAVQAYEVILPVYAGCTYGYEKSHLKETTADGTLLAYKKDEMVKLDIRTETETKVKEVHVFGASGNEITVSWNNGEELEFTMPGQNVTVKLKMEEHIEKETAVDEAAEKDSEPAHFETEMPGESLEADHSKEYAEAADRDGEMLYENAEVSPESGNGSSEEQTESVIPEISEESAEPEGQESEEQPETEMTEMPGESAEPEGQESEEQTKTEMTEMPEESVEPENRESEEQPKTEVMETSEESAEPENRESEEQTETEVMETSEESAKSD